MMMRSPSRPSFFFFNDTATTEIYTLSLHDALPIFASDRRRPAGPGLESKVLLVGRRAIRDGGRDAVDRETSLAAAGRVVGQLGRAAADLEVVVSIADGRVARQRGRVGGNTESVIPIVVRRIRRERGRRNTQDFKAVAARVPVGRVALHRERAAPSHEKPAVLVV